jgi:hypothetical protein
MTNNGDAAEQVVRLTLEGVEVSAKIAGAGAKQIAAMLYAMSKDQHRTRGKIRLANLLKSGQELKVFTVSNQNLREFQREAKRYGVLYCALRGAKADPDGVTDIMVRASDAAKISRIVERFQLSQTVDVASIQAELGQEREGGASPSVKTRGRTTPSERPSGRSRAERKSSLDGDSRRTSVRGKLNEIKNAQAGKRENGKARNHARQGGKRLVKETGR